MVLQKYKVDVIYFSLILIIILGHLDHFYKLLLMSNDRFD